MNLKNRTIFCKDNLDILTNIDSNCVDLVYLDPPFNKKKVFSAPIGSSAEGAEFSDIFREEDVKEEWVQTIKEDNFGLYELLDFTRKAEGRSSYNFCYLAYMSIRLLEIQRILKDTGSVYLHCDPTMSHYLKLVMDCVFGNKNFRNEIIWHYRRWTGKAKVFQKLHDTIFYYSKTDNRKFNLQYTDYTAGSKDRKLQGVLNRFKEGKKTFVSDGEISTSGVRENDVWHIPFIAPSSKERTGYPTQKPLKLLERIIKASSNEGDLVLDPFCGCATTCVAAERLNRKWVGIDVSHKAYDLVRERLEADVSKYGQLEIGEDSVPKVDFSTTPPIKSENIIQEKKWIYVISNEAFPNEFKVGIASDWKSRLNSYQTSDPNRAYKMEFKVLVANYREIERYIHQKFENRHEWVQASLENIIEEIDKIKT